MANAALQGVLELSAAKVFRLGTHRICTPEETLSRFRPTMGALGITRLGLCTGLDQVGIPVAFAVRPNAFSISVSQGKGITDAQAMASALMEAAELAHAENLHDAIKIASRKELTPDASIILPLAAGFQAPAPDEPTHWIEGWDLLQQVPCWTPAALVHTDFRLPRAKADWPFLACTNGLASGNHLLEALCAAICEVVERDALAIWHARSLEARAATRLDLDTVGDPDCRLVLNCFARSGMDVAVWDIISDVGVPAFFAILTQTRAACGPALREFHGAGCHPCPAVALSRALTEAAQARLTRIAGARDDLQEDEVSRDAIIARLLLDLLYDGPGRPFASELGGSGNDLGEDVKWLLGRLRGAGIDRVVAVDLTSSGLGMPVVRVIVPALEPPRDHPGYVRGVRARRAAR